MLSLIFKANKCHPICSSHQYSEIKRLNWNPGVVCLTRVVWTPVFCLFNVYSFIGLPRRCSRPLSQPQNQIPTTSIHRRCWVTSRSEAFSPRCSLSTPWSGRKSESVEERNRNKKKNPWEHKQHEIQGQLTKQFQLLEAIYKNLINHKHGIFCLR